MFRPFELREDPVPGTGVVVLGLHGELEVGTASHLRRAVSGLLGVGRRSVVLDLTGVAFVDSSGIGALLWAQQRIEHAGGETAAVVDDEVVGHLLALTGLDQVLAVEPSREAAIARLAPPRNHDERAPRARSVAARSR